MRAKSIQTFVRNVCGVAFVASIILAPAVAQAGCYPSDQEMPAGQVDAFLKDPASLLASNPAGGSGLISQVRDLVGSNAATLQPVLDLLKNANAEQKAGIGSGLSHAAAACLSRDQAFATEIQRMLAASGDKDAILAYTMVAGGQDTAAVGGGGGGGGGGVGGPTTGAAASGGGGGGFGAPQQNTGGTETVPANFFTGNSTVTSSAALATSPF